VIGGTGCRLNPSRGGRWGGCHGWREAALGTVRGAAGPGRPVPRPGGTRSSGGAATALPPFPGGMERPPQASGPGAAGAGAVGRPAGLPAAGLQLL